MIAVALKGLLGRKVRAILTAFAIVLGVAMVSGTFVLTDTIERAFNGVFRVATDGVAVVVGTSCTRRLRSTASPVRNATSCSIEEGRSRQFTVDSQRSHRGRESRARLLALCPLCSRRTLGVSSVSSSRVPKQNHISFLHYVLFPFQFHMALFARMH